MGQRLVGSLLVAFAALPAHGQTRLDIRNAAAEVVIIPEARPDVRVSVTRANPPLRLMRRGDTLIVDGGLPHRVHGCPVIAGAAAIRLRDLGDRPVGSLPRIIARTPLDVVLSFGDGVSGVIGRSRSLNLETRGCGRWTIANVAGRLAIDDVGSTRVRTGRSGAANISVDGEGSVSTKAIGGSLMAISSGAGSIDVESVAGSFVARVAGSGSVSVARGTANPLNASVAGSGGVRFGGVAGSVTASVAGSGVISIARASGPVSRRTFGPGEILVGR